MVSSTFQEFCIPRSMSKNYYSTESKGWILSTEKPWFPFGTGVLPSKKKNHIKHSYIKDSNAARYCSLTKKEINWHVLEGSYRQASIGMICLSGKILEMLYVIWHNVPKQMYLHSSYDYWKLYDKRTFLYWGTVRKTN